MAVLALPSGLRTAGALRRGGAGSTKADPKGLDRSVQRTWPRSLSNARRARPSCAAGRREDLSLTLPPDISRVVRHGHGNR